MKATLSPQAPGEQEEEEEEEEEEEGQEQTVECGRKRR